MTATRSRQRGEIYVGVGGWTFAPWRKNFYPEGLPHSQELAYAGEHLTAIEINGTFYRHQSPESFASWRDAVPHNFVFAVKAHRATTHGKDLTAAGPAIERFLESGLVELGEKLGPILWQLPHTKKFDIGVMGAFLSALPARLGGVKLRHAVEARHASFLDPQWPALAARYGVAVVIVDSDKQDLRGDVTADFVYARLQRNSAAEPDGYAGSALDAWAARFRAWAGGRTVSGVRLLAPAAEAIPRTCYVFFISGDKERAPAAATAMLERLSRTL